MLILRAMNFYFAYIIVYEYHVIFQRFTIYYPFLIKIQRKFYSVSSICLADCLDQSTECLFACGDDVVCAQACSRYDSKK